MAYSEILKTITLQSLSVVREKRFPTRKTKVTYPFHIQGECRACATFCSLPLPLKRFLLGSQHRTDSSSPTSEALKTMS